MRQIEEGFEVIGAVDDETRGIVARNWPKATTCRQAGIPKPDTGRYCRTLQLNGNRWV